MYENWETGHLSQGLCEGSVANNHTKKEKQDVERLKQELTGRPKRMGIPKFKFKECFLCENQKAGWNSHNVIVLASGKLADLSEIQFLNL